MSEHLLASSQLPQGQDTVESLTDGLVQVLDVVEGSEGRAGEGDDLARDLAAGDLTAAWALGALVGEALVGGRKLQ